MLTIAWKVSAGGSRSGGVASFRRRSQAPEWPRALRASRFARLRVERSELVWSALGAFSITSDDAPVRGDTRLAFIPDAMRSPNAFPAIVLPSTNCAIENAAATVVSSLMTMGPSGTSRPKTFTSSTPFGRLAVA